MDVSQDFTDNPRILLFLLQNGFLVLIDYKMMSLSNEAVIVCVGVLCQRKQQVELISYLTHIVLWKAS